MIGQYLISFREVLEAALITAIILAYLSRTKRDHLSRYVWIGVHLSVGVSMVLGIAIWTAYGNLSEISKVLFEGIAALIAVIVLTSMICWMALKGSKIKEELELKVGSALKRRAEVAMISVSFIVVFREGLETVLFLTPFLMIDAVGTIGGALLGLMSGLALALVIFKVGMKIDLRRFFYFTSILLISLAAGLLGYALHEFAEYVELTGGDLGVWGQYAYTLNISSDSILHHKGAVGSILAVMFGYATKMEWIRVVGHALYLAIVLPLVIILYQKPEIVERIAGTLKRIGRLLGFRKDRPDDS